MLSAPPAASWELRSSAQARRLLNEVLQELASLLGALLRGLVRSGL